MRPDGHEARKYPRLCHRRIGGGCARLGFAFEFEGHIGERAVDIAQLAAITIAAGMRVDDLARIPFAYPTYAGALARTAASAAHLLNLEVGWQAHQVESALH
jgi:hypothetical protein